MISYELCDSCGRTPKGCGPTKFDIFGVSLPKCRITNVYLGRFNQGLKAAPGERDMWYHREGEKEIAAYARGEMKWSELQPYAQQRYKFMRARWMKFRGDLSNCSDDDRCKRLVPRSCLPYYLRFFHIPI